MPNILNYAMLSQDVYEKSPAGNGGYKPSLKVPRANGPDFVAVAYARSDHEPVIIAIRGSETQHDWGDADADLAQGDLPTDYVGAAFDFFNSATKADLPGMRDRTRKIVLTGHSLGGALAAIVAGRITTRPVIGVTFNSPGVDAFFHLGTYVDPSLAEGVQTAAKVLEDVLFPTLGALNLTPVNSLRQIGAGAVAKKAMNILGGGGGGMLNIPKSNAKNVWHVRSQYDAVSGLRPPSLGHTLPVKGLSAGVHNIGPLVTALRADRIAYFRPAGW